MRFFVKAVATGFAMSLGSALFKKVSKKIGLDSEEGQKQGARAEAANGDEDTGLEDAEADSQDRP